MLNFVLPNLCLTFFEPLWEQYPAIYPQTESLRFYFQSSNWKLLQLWHLTQQ